MPLRKNNGTMVRPRERGFTIFIMQGTIKALFLIFGLVVVALAWRAVDVRTTDEEAAPDAPTETSDAILDDTSMQVTAPGTLPAEQIENKQVRITTEMGDIVVGLYPDTAPLAVSNMVSLASQGYYDGIIFHRVIEGFMIQGGDPTGTGRGGPGYKFADELDDDRTYTRGTVAMANAGANTNGSQFFIMHKDYALPHSYTIFGYVISGMDVVDRIATSSVDEDDRPLEKIVMTKVTVEEME